MTEPILVNATEGEAWSGRPRGTIWRWASEGRLTRYGEGNKTRYDRNEIPSAEEGGRPPVRHPRGEKADGR